MGDFSLPNLDVEQDLIPSDHFVVNFSLTTKFLNKTVPRSVFNYKRANWVGLKWRY